MTSFIPIHSRLLSLGFKLIAGVDEVGRGPLAGPLVAAAVVLKKDTIIPNLKDSKLLSEQEREKLYPEIIKASQDYAITFISHKVIDELNILNSTRLANHLCVQALSKKPDLVLIDGRDKQYLATKYQTIIKGDQKVKEIAAASVLAKVARDKLMKHYSKLYKNYKLEVNKGYGTRSHIGSIRKYGPSDIHRKSFTIKPQQLSIEL